MDALFHEMNVGVLCWREELTHGGGKDEQEPVPIVVRVHLPPHDHKLNKNRPEFRQ